MLQISYESARMPGRSSTASGLVRTTSNGGIEGPAGSGVLRPTEGESRCLVLAESTRELPVLGEVDVLVCGGGPAGTGAAIGAARAGASTLLLERYGFLGGMASGGLVIPHFDAFLNEGINLEIMSALKERGAWGAPFWRISYDPETWKHVTEELVLESGSDLLYHALAVAAVMDGDRIRGVVVESKTGRFAVLAKAVVDCTGDGDIAARAGAPFSVGRPVDGLTQPITMMFRLGGVRWVQRSAAQLREMVEQAAEREGHSYRLPFLNPWILHLPNPNEVVVQLTHVRGVDATEIRELTRAEVDGRRQVKALVSFLKVHVPEFREAYLIETACQIGVRETRHFAGDYVLTRDDLVAARTFPDAVATVSFSMDMHNPVGLNQSSDPLSRPYHVPYRSLLPKGVEGLLIAGRCISGTHDAAASYRVKGPCLAMGQAAGIAAALAARLEAAPRSTDFSAIRSEMIRQGVRVDRLDMPPGTLAHDPDELGREMTVDGRLNERPLS
jgi:hypothetical protein